MTFECRSISLTIVPLYIQQCGSIMTTSILSQLTWTPLASILNHPFIIWSGQTFFRLISKAYEWLGTKQNKEVRYHYMLYILSIILNLYCIPHQTIVRKYYNSVKGQVDRYSQMEWQHCAGLYHDHSGQYYFVKSNVSVLNTSAMFTRFSLCKMSINADCMS